MQFNRIRLLCLLSVLCILSINVGFAQNVLNSGSFYQTDDVNNYQGPLQSANNTKTVDRIEVEVQHLSGGVWLNYRLRFQNTTTNTINYIRLKDSLSYYLDFNTFEYRGSTHQGQYTLYTSGNLYVYYTQINLLDSSTDLAASQGWFQF